MGCSGVVLESMDTGCIMDATGITGPMDIVGIMATTVMEAHMASEDYIVTEDHMVLTAHTGLTVLTDLMAHTVPTVHLGIMAHMEATAHMVTMALEDLSVITAATIWRNAVLNGSLTSYLMEPMTSTMAMTTSRMHRQRKQAIKNHLTNKAKLRMIATNVSVPVLNVTVEEDTGVGG